MTPRRKRLAAGLLALALTPLAAFFVLDALYPFPLDRLDPAPAMLVTARDGAPLRQYLAPDQSARFPAPLSDMSPVFVSTILASEDRFFYRHPGVNPLALWRAALSNLLSGRVVSGGSTITMQLARLAEPKARTAWAKCREMFRAVQLELRFDKTRILTWYLNLAPYGGNVVGVDAAARHHFGKAPRDLSLAEAALLAALPRGPVRHDPFKNPEAARRARAAVLDRLLSGGHIDLAAHGQATAAPLPAAPSPPPFAAPHFCDLARDKAPRAARLSTTLDRARQAAAEEVLRGRRDWLAGLGIGGAAAVVLDTRSRDILAMAVSPGVFADPRHGWINGAVIRRSPGSALKPFLYAQAMDAGLIAPESRLLDIPTSFAGYAPKNYDGLFRGRVTAEEALAHSLNVPAVRLLDTLGQKAFHDLLVRGGLGSLSKPAAHYGLSLVLGGGEVTLLDLTNLYATLAAGGAHRPPRALPAPPGQDGPSIRLFSPEAAHLVTRVLSRVERPDLPASWDRAMGVPAVAWKTGTSYGHRDAWAIGYTDHLAVGVWVGNMDGSPVSGISGAVHAGPILFELFRALGEDGPGHVRDPYLDLAEVELCAESRQLAGPDCPRRIMATVMPGRTRLSPCPVHRRILVDAATGLRLSGDCLAGREAAQAVAAFHPAELVGWWRAAGIPFESPPDLAPDCERQESGEGPRIVSPSPHTPYIARPDAPASDQRIALLAEAPAGVGTLFWYLDGRPVARGAPGERLFLEAGPGRRRLVVQDEAGRLDAVVFEVREN